MAQPAPEPVWVCYQGGPPPDAWALPDEPVPESPLHNDIVLLMHLLLVAWAARLERAVLVADNLALRWSPEKPAAGLDPDLSLYEPPPPEVEALTSVCTWLPGHAPPKVALEVVSPGHPYKDYEGGPLRYAASGTGELWVFDPLLAGPKRGGGPHRLQLWARAAGGRLERVYAGPGPCRSPYLGAWLVVVEGGRRLRLSDDAKGQRLWSTGEEAAQAGERAARRAERRAEAKVEAERAAKEAERAAKEAERAAKDEALARLARLEAELAALRRGD